MHKILLLCTTLLLLATSSAQGQTDAPGPMVRSITLSYVNENGSLGVAFNKLTDSITHLFGVQEARGMWVSCVTNGEAAAQAGVVPGDVVVALNGQVVSDVEDLPRLVDEVPIGETATLSIVRNQSLSTRLQQAVAEEDPAGQYVMGMILAKRLCRYDESNAPSEATVLPLFANSAAKGFLPAQIELGWMYQNGIVVQQDPVNAVRWFERAATQGSADAQLYVGLAYHLGQGIPQNIEQAVTWYERAAEQQHPKAQTMLGLMFEHGFGVARNLQTASDWYRKAAAQGYEDAIKRLKVLER